MKKQLLKSVLMMVAGIGLLAGSAMADDCQPGQCSPGSVTFDITNINFTNVTGATDGVLTWGLTAGAPLSFVLTQGQINNFVYGTFNATDFPISKDEGKENNDKFTTNFTIAPPALGNNASGNASVDATYDRNSDGSMAINFNNSWHTLLLANGLKYEWRLNDLNGISGNGDYDLTAEIKLDCAANPVPEPTTMLLFGSGLLGLAGFARRKVQ